MVNDVLFFFSLRLATVRVGARLKLPGTSTKQFWNEQLTTFTDKKKTKKGWRRTAATAHNGIEPSSFSSSCCSSAHSSARLVLARAFLLAVDDLPPEEGNGIVVVVPHKHTKPSAVYLFLLDYMKQVRQQQHARINYRYWLPDHHHHHPPPLAYATDSKL